MLDLFAYSIFTCFAGHVLLLFVLGFRIKFAVRGVLIRFADFFGWGLALSIIGFIITLAAHAGNN